MNWFLIENIEKVDSPALVVFPDRVEGNIQLLVNMIDDVSRLRPHVKTHKTKEICLMLMKEGIHKFKCATIAEAEMLGMAGAKDVLLAYQLVGPKLKRFLSLIKKYPSTKFSCLVDNKATLEELNKYALSEKENISVYIDLNVGMNRTGIVPDIEAMELYRRCVEFSTISFKGLHAYDGHIHDKDIQRRKTLCDEAYIKVDELRIAIEKESKNAITLILGGTPTFPIHAMREKVECSPGTFVYWDAGYLTSYSEQPFLPAAIVVSRIISFPKPNWICLDMGHKSIAAEKSLAERFKVLTLGEFSIVSQSEEHVVLETIENHNFKIGDIFYILPRHICPTVALYKKAYIVKNNKVEGEWEIIARDRKIEC